MTCRPSTLARATAIATALLASRLGLAAAQAPVPARDTAARADSAARAPVASPVVVDLGPSDTVLARACSGEPGGGEAPGLLAVIFRAGTPDRERAAAAKSVGGTLAGPNGYGEEYVRLPDGAGPLPAVADRLIRQAAVTSVSPAPCPPPVPTPVGPGTAPGTPADSAPAAPARASP